MEEPPSADEWNQYYRDDAQKRIKKLEDRLDRVCNALKDLGILVESDPPIESQEFKSTFSEIVRRAFT